MWWYIAGFYGALPVLVFAAYRWGGIAERAVAVLFVAAAVLSVVGRAIENGFLFYLVRTEYLVSVIDLALLIALIVLAVRTPVWWLLCEASLQLLTMMSHVAKMLGSPFTGLAYALMAGASSYPALILLGLGILQHYLRRRSA